MKGREKKLVVIGGGLLEIRNARYYGKNAVIKYLHGLSPFYDNIVFVTKIHKGQFFQTVLDNKVKVYFLQKHRSKLISYYRDLSSLKYICRDNHVIIFVPNTWHILLFPVVRHNAACIGLYLAGDWIDQPRQFGTKPGMRYLLKKADVVFGRGHTCEIAKRYNKNVWESMPIISFKGFSYRNERFLMSSENMQELRLLTVCTLSKRKSVQYILKAIHILINQRGKKFKGIRLDIVGDGPDRHFLEHETSVLNLKDYVKFHGYVDDPVKLSGLYFRADAFIFHSFHEGQPRVLDEAVLHNLPIIAVDLEGIRKNFTHMEDALLFKPGQASAICDFIKKLLGDRRLGCLLAENAKMKYNNHFHFEDAATQHAALLKQAAKRRNL